jgi:transposase-like protein
MRNIRTRHDATFKIRVAPEAVKGEKKIAQLSSDHSVHSNLILFSNNKRMRSKDKPADLQSELCRQIGQFKVVLDCLRDVNRGDAVRT